jgi:photosystem II stability/assembly factor-like uncharacterized protein
MGWRVIAFAPSNPQRVYAGTGAFMTASNFDNKRFAKGVYASDNGGRRWFPASDPMTKNAQIADLAIDPQYPGVVYAASTTHGMLKTVNGGKSWERINQGLPQVKSSPPLSVAVDPVNRGIIYCGLENSGVYRSFNAGETWMRLEHGMEPNASVADIVVDPRRPGVVYAADLRSGVYRISGGSTGWERINHGLEMRSVNHLGLSNDASILYAATEGNGVYRMKLPEFGQSDR